MKRTLRTTLLTTDALIAAEPDADGPPYARIDLTRSDRSVSGWTPWWTPAATALTFTLPQSAASSTAAAAGSSAPAGDPAPDARVPEGGAEPASPEGS
ncbi:hypothetical protein PGH47_01655 [Streptomyces sp. HUAS 31]|uniref:hypothetical protein n=1 Tax=Streptomyces sp. HUAS 31 TaxID=3020055 RepID=UPI0023067B0B|nr:hypothetical protein [Streptomyces sp. HUAS 31]WCD94420.1 hypothetical protein PGH47_01655 [Streptomyces sp. HUAS 31]